MASISSDTTETQEIDFELLANTSGLSQKNRKISQGGSYRRLAGTQLDQER